MLNKTVVALSVSLLLGACASSPENVCHPNTMVNIETSDVPTIKSGDKQYIVLPIDINFEESAADKLKATLINQLETQLINSGVKVVDRNLARKLQTEIKLAEQSGRYNTKGVPIADFAIITEVTKSELSKSHNETRYYENKDGETKKIPASCDYRVEFAAITKVVSLPNMALIKRIELRGNDSFSTETTNSRCPISEAQYSGLALASAIESIEHDGELKELLAPSAPVLELRHCDSGPMVKIGMGSKTNIQPDTEVSFANAIKNSEGEIETFAVGEGDVVDIPMHGIKPEYSWVMINEETALKIKKGDEARIVPKRCSSYLDLECQARAIGL
ncbi:hypothetical protein [Shewanella pealeana]|uniref:Lipoprotein n=2 Tax=Shewanella pealeana TaxID=70864 RepID=A8H655_SHEPA|nr:hypothetical protein Spea_2722 [Shewanella pealeana ATCC 700345]